MASYCAANRQKVRTPQQGFRWLHHSRLVIYAVSGHSYPGCYHRKVTQFFDSFDIRHVAHNNT